MKTVGFDSSPILIQQFQDGIVDALLIQNPFKMGETAVNEAVEAARQNQIPRRLFLPPRLVTATDLSDRSVQEQLQPDLVKYLGSD